MAVFGFSAVEERDCEAFAQRFDTMMLSLYDNEYKDIKIIKFGPFRNGIYKVLGKFRQRIIIKYKRLGRRSIF
jgi:hypothetical protein